MRRMNAIRWLIIVTCCNISCTRTIEVTPPVHEPRLVLHGYVATGEKFHVAINQTVQANSVMNGFESFVTNAWVLLFEDGVFADSLRYDAQRQRYLSQNVVAVAGKTYKVVAGADGFTTVEASARASFPVHAVAVMHNKQVRRDTNGQLLDDILFSFNDAANEKNFYTVAIYPSSWRPGYSSCVYSNDPAIDRVRGEILPFEDGGCLDNKQILLSDKSFNGNLKQLTLSTFSDMLVTLPDSSGNLHRPYLKRSIISEEHYIYVKTALSLLAGGVVPSLNNPVSVKGNVKNGYGIFDVFSVTTDTLR